ncbi:MAG: S8 family serine peptidase [Acidobacteriota bacterium]
MKYFLLLLCFVQQIVVAQARQPAPSRAQGIVLGQEAAPADSIAPVIVEFKEAPLFLARRTSVAASDAGFYEKRFSDFSSHLTGASGLKKSGVQAPALMKKYYKAFFGAAVSVPASEIPALAQLPYVKAVHADHPVAAHLETSIVQTRTDQAWTAFGTRGRGVRIGVLDTGIDYRHPALGGHIGPGYTVEGGYDFVNRDADPMDDNGHGTHVAGIIAAHGSGVQGFAPEAALVAYKVLDAQGKGKESDILEAIEHAVDPDGNGDESDHLDIVNLSLGSDNGDPDDAKSTAVDQATELGVTFCISAGNSGRFVPVQGKEHNYYFTSMETISSPGTARRAITVGAVDASDKAADFSSKGPSSRTFGIKPDIAAPGVNIHSLAIGGGLAYKSGTSMASPMIAGMAALLKSADRSLTPDEIKSALVNSSADLGTDVMLLGSGRADAMRALSQRTFAVPSSIEYGFDDPSLPVWTASETLRVTNRRPGPQQFEIAWTGMRGGVTLSAQPRSFTLAPGASLAVIVSLSVDNAAVPIADDDIFIFGGSAVVAGSADTLRIPWAFTRARQMLLEFSDSDVRFVGSGSEYLITSTYGRTDSKVIWKDRTTARVIGLPSDAYDFAVYYPSLRKLVTKEHVAFPDLQRIAFTPDDARHIVSLEGVDDNGVALRGRKGSQALLRVDLPTTMWLWIPFEEGQHSLLVTPASPAVTFYGMESLVDCSGSKRVFIPQFPAVKGISSDLRMTNDPSLYKKQTVRFMLPSSVQRAKIYAEVDAVLQNGGSEFFNAAQVAVDTVDASDGSAEVALHLMKPVDPVYGSSIRFHVNHSDLSRDVVDYASPHFSIVNDSVLSGLVTGRTIASFCSPSGGTTTLGAGPVSILNRSYNNASGTSIQFDPIFRGPVSENRYGDVVSATYVIADKHGRTLYQGNLAEAHAPFPVPAAAYDIRYEAETYDVGDVRARLRMTNSVDLTKAVPDPPVFTSMRIIGRNGSIAQRVKQNDALTLVFASKVYAYPFQLPVPESTVVEMRRYGAPNWARIPVALVRSDPGTSGALFSADLSAWTSKDSAAIDLRVRVADAYGNASELIVSPAFAVGPWKRGAITDIENPPLAAFTFGLAQNYPNPFNPSTTITYEIAEKGRAELAVFDVLGRRVRTLVDRAHLPGRYTHNFDASGLASGIYICRLIQESRSAAKTMMVLK